MKKITALVLALALIFAFAGCGANGGAAKDIDIAAVKTQILSDLSIEGAMDIGTDRLLDLYGIEAADVSESACYVTMDGVFPEEVIMVKAADDAAASRIKEKLENRLAEVKTQSANYDAENFALANECKVLTNGNYVAMFLSAKHADMEKIFESAGK